jgi:hypothetical protein
LQKITRDQRELCVIKSLRKVKNTSLNIVVLFNPKNASEEKVAKMCEKDLYLRHLCKTYVIQIGGYLYGWCMEIIRSEVATL